MATTNKRFEKSPADKETPGQREGSRAEEAADARAQRPMPYVRKRTPGKNKASVI